MVVVVVVVLIVVLVNVVLLTVVEVLASGDGVIAVTTLGHPTTFTC